MVKMVKSSDNTLVVNFKNQYYDFTNFRHKHPGGLNTLNGLDSTNITERFNQAPKHSKAAMYLLNEYKIKNNNLVDENNNEVDVDRTTSLSDDSMEHLVDWSRAMLPQIAKLGSDYNEWVNKPVDRNLRLFRSNFLESLTKTPWWLVPGIWIPSIMYLIKLGYNDIITNNDNIYLIFLNLVVGVIVWTLLEYSLHRWVFHLKVDNGNKYLITFHFLIHGLHHKVPFDPYRLVFPPFPAFILATLFYQPVRLLFGNPILILAGGLIGYLCYDMTHYYIHYGSPSSDGHFYNMKRYHYQHHFAHHDLGFGISSPIWDNVFSTEIILRKLKYVLKW